MPELMEPFGFTKMKGVWTSVGGGRPEGCQVLEGMGTFTVWETQQLRAQGLGKRQQRVPASAALLEAAVPSLRQHSEPASDPKAARRAEQRQAGAVLGGREAGLQTADPPRERPAPGPAWGLLTAPGPAWGLLTAPGPGA